MDIFLQLLLAVAGCFALALTVVAALNSLRVR